MLQRCQSPVGQGHLLGCAVFEGLVTLQSRDVVLMGCVTPGDTVLMGCAAPGDTAPGSPAPLCEA